MNPVRFWDIRSWRRFGIPKLTSWNFGGESSLYPRAAGNVQSAPAQKRTFEEPAARIRRCIGPMRTCRRLQFIVKTLMLLMLAVATFFAGQKSAKLRQAKSDSPNLSATINADCREMPLREFLSILAKRSNTSIYVDERECANTQNALRQPITMKLGIPVSLDSARSLALEPLYLGYYIKDGRVVVTSESFIMSASEPMISPNGW